MLLARVTLLQPMLLIFLVIFWLVFLSALDHVFLPNPQARNFHTPAEYEDLILHDTGENDPTRILAIGSYDLLRVLNSHLFLCDGAFDVTPLVFFQLYTIHCPVGNNYPPIIYFLLPHKSQQTYRRMMQIVKELVPTANPLKVLTDFELAAINAFREDFPEAELSGCYFHLSQSIVRKVGELGLKNQFENDQNFNLLVKDNETTHTNI